MDSKIKFICNAVKWFDKVNGNTYHSVRVTRCSDGKVIADGFQYGYGEQYRDTALALMLKNGFLPEKYFIDVLTGKSNLYLYERENGYPILWNVSKGLKRDCIANGTI